MSVRASSGALARRLLGTHVLRRAERQSRSRVMRLAPAVRTRERDAEVGDERLARRAAGCSPA